VLYWSVEMKPPGPDGPTGQRDAAATVEPAVLVMRDVSRCFSAGGRMVRAVDGVSLAVRRGELAVVLGRSGAGKTTLLSLAGGLDRPDAGQVWVEGKDVAALRGTDLDRFLGSTVGWVFQTSGLLPLLTAAENVALALLILGQDEEQAMAAALSGLEEVGMAARAQHRAHELSGGEQQRVALVRALVKQPALLLADEPTAQLDTETAGSVIALLREAADSGIAVLLATHDIAADDLADQVLNLEDGKVIGC
jgi:putative ABC transport system ATP-binding protein